MHPASGRRGVGSAIVRELERLAVASGIPALDVTASLNAEAFYMQHGYQSLGAGDSPLQHGFGDGLREDEEEPRASERRLAGGVVSSRCAEHCSPALHRSLDEATVERFWSAHQATAMSR